MKRFFRNIPWQNILIITLVAVLGIGAIVGIASIVKEEKKEISSLAFKRGAIDLNGNYVESKTSIYTKDLIECQGLEIVPDFEATGDYQVFYYDVNKLFLGKSNFVNAHTGGVYVKGENFPYAKYCRIMITPETPKDDNGITIEDYEIKFYEVTGIANKFTISVNKDQKKVNVENFFLYGELYDGKTFTVSEADRKLSLFADSGFNVCELEVGKDKYVNCNSIEVKFSSATGEYEKYAFVDENGVAIELAALDGAKTSYLIEIPENAVAFILVYLDDNLPTITRAS